MIILFQVELFFGAVEREALDEIYKKRAQGRLRVPLWTGQLGQRSEGNADESIRIRQNPIHTLLKN